MCNELLHGGSMRFNDLKEIDLAKCNDSGYGKGFWLTDRLTDRLAVARLYALKNNKGTGGFITCLSLKVNIEDILILDPEESRRLSIHQLLKENMKVIKIWETDHSPSYSYRVVDLSVLDIVLSSEAVSSQVY